MTVRKHQGFSLFDLLVVIVILAVLVFALAPAIRGAINQAHATTMKERGRRIWIAVVDANIDRQDAERAPLWPENVKDEVVDTATYFTYLLAEDEMIDQLVATNDQAVVTNAQTVATNAHVTVANDQIAVTVERRRVIELDLGMFRAPGVEAYTGTNTIPTENMAWRVTEVGQGSSPDIAFLVSRNVGDEAIQQGVDENDVNRITLAGGVLPFGDERAVWVSKGGSTFDARAKYLYTRIVMGIGTNTVPIWK